MILITGASGNAGGAVLSAAINLKLPVRAMYRSGACTTVDNAVQDLLDKSVRTLDNYLSENKAAFSSKAA